MKKCREEKTKFSKILPNQIITACRIELRVHEITMNKKLTMMGLMTLCRCLLINIFFATMLQHCETMSQLKNNYVRMLPWHYVSAGTGDVVGSR